MVTYVKHERLWLQSHADLDERWLQSRIAEDPSILGLGELVLLSKELIQPRAGRLDLLLREATSNRRFEVEVQLGRTDESHIITIEYWDLERKRYPQYDHCAVIVAEDITSRFLNVISLFNGFIPLVAIQVAAIRIENQVALTFTKVLDHQILGPVDDDLEEQAPATRAYWEDKSNRETLAVVDSLFALVQEFEPKYELKYNKHFIGLARNGKPDNFLTLQPRKQWVRVGVALPESPEITSTLEQAGLKAEFDPRWRRYVLTVEKSDLPARAGALSAHFKAAYSDWTS
jgi:hypothetical protein